MKHSIYTILILATGLVSCNKFLDKFPTTSLSSGTMFTTEETAESVVTGAYNSLRYGLGTMWATNLDCFADVFDPAEDRLGTSYLLLNGSATSRVAMFEEFWKNYYEGINRANDVINNYSHAPVSEELKARRIAECRFLRAFWYYRLNSLWHGVPVYTENLAPDQYTKARMSEKEVWEFIVTELGECISCAELPQKYDSSDPDYGRVTKGAAYALRGKAYLWLKEWAKAEADFIKVGECGYGMFDGSYADLFTVTNEKCKEMIFSCIMTDTKGYGNCFSYNYGNHCTTGTGQNAYTVSTRFADSFECADGKPFSWDDFIPGYSSVEPAARRVYFLRDGLSESEKTAQTDLGADMSKYLPDGNEARIKAAYANRDPRLAALAITPYSEYIGGSSGEEQAYTYRYPYKTKNEPIFDVETALPSNFFYPIRKFVVVGRDCTTVEYNPLDIPFIRYAEVALGLAEALNEQGRTTEAVEYVNMVRSRAGVAPLGSNSFTQVTDQEDLRSRIRKEEKWEFAGEQILYGEEMRWGTWLEDKYSDGNGLEHAWGAGILQYTSGGAHYASWPVPGGEVERNGNLVQNEGWIE